jgi:hypothetical protein
MAIGFLHNFKVFFNNDVGWIGKRTTLKCTDSILKAYAQNF